MKLKIIYSHEVDSGGILFLMHTTVFGVTFQDTYRMGWQQWDAFKHVGSGTRQGKDVLLHMRLRLREQVLTSDALPAPALGSFWRHKNGTVYRVRHVTSVPEKHKAQEFPVTIIYEGPDGRTWPRTLPRWYASMTFTGHNP